MGHFSPSCLLPWFAALYFQVGVDRQNLAYMELSLWTSARLTSTWHSQSPLWESLGGEGEGGYWPTPHPPWVCGILPEDLPTSSHSWAVAFPLKNLGWDGCVDLESQCTLYSSDWTFFPWLYPLSPTSKFLSSSAVSYFLLSLPHSQPNSPGFP